MTAYYNENDRYAAAWLDALIRRGLIPDGHVDNRSVLDVPADDLKGYTQCHFFAGIGGWSLALHLAGWPDNRPVWTGSCPCQPLSSAGRQRGHVDERHLWPAFHALIAQCRPATIFGEQVASKDGREWLAGVRADLEHLGYAVGAADLCAASAGAPHIRQRLYWVADAGSRGHMGSLDAGERQQRVVEAQSAGGERTTDRLGDAEHARLEVGRRRSDELPDAQGRQDALGYSGHAGEAGFWGNYSTVPCSDGKARRFEPGSFPLAHGVPARVGRLRAYGNAIVPQVAATFMRAWMETTE